MCTDVDLFLLWFSTFKFKWFKNLLIITIRSNSVNPELLLLANQTPHEYKRTLLLQKWDCPHRCLIGKILDRFESKVFKLVAMVMMHVQFMKRFLFFDIFHWISNTIFHHICPGIWKSNGKDLRNSYECIILPWVDLSTWHLVPFNDMGKFGISWKSVVECWVQSSHLKFALSVIHGSHSIGDVN